VAVAVVAAATANYPDEALRSASKLSATPPAVHSAQRGVNTGGLYQKLPWPVGSMRAEQTAAVQALATQDRLAHSAEVEQRAPRGAAQTSDAHSPSAHSASEEHGAPRSPTRERARSRRGRLRDGSAHRAFAARGRLRRSPLRRFLHQQHPARHRRWHEEQVDQRDHQEQTHAGAEAEHGHRVPRDEGEAVTQRHAA